jgi:ADP-ribose pyrophosphatase
MLQSLRQLKTELLDKNPWWQYRKDRYMRPDGSEGEYYYVRTLGSVMVIPITTEKKIVMVKQFRYLNQKVSIEFIGGGVKKGLSAEESAREELIEEAGIIAGELTKIGAFNPMNGVSDEMCNIFVAEALKRNSPRPEASEEFEVLELRHSELCKLIEQRSIWDGMTLAAAALLEQRKDRFLL